MAEEKKKCFEAGCDEYITKPIDINHLLSVIDKHFTKN
jgi:CheY-like chemotaxis protein